VLLPDEIFQTVGPHALGKRALGIRSERRIGRGRCGIEQAHARTVLCRRASYSRMPAATAAFSDSTPTVGIEMACAAARSTLPTPRASLPITRPQGRTKFT